jgi:putative flippase GtrA
MRTALRIRRRRILHFARSTGKRWLKFNLVGLGGVLVQLGLLEVWTHFALGNYLLGTALGVEGALLHNFGWHCVYTWRDRGAAGVATIAGRAFRFHVSNGVVSLLGNLFLMHLLVSEMHSPLLLANSVAILACSAINFLLGDRFVFGDTG